jgi:outer membrane protein assembly factor BamB
VGCAVVLLVAGLTSGARVTSAADTPDDAVSYRIDPTHSGAQPHDQLALPLHQRWAVDFGCPMYWYNVCGRVSYPLIAGGRIFVTTVHPGYGTDLFAIDANTGRILWGPEVLGGVYNFSAIAYDLDRVFAINHSGELRAFDAATGRLDWSLKLFEQYFFDSPPTAAGGIVYVTGAGGNGALYAVAEATGAVMWAKPVIGLGSAPTVSSNAVYLTYGCEQDAFDRLTGTGLWHRHVGCLGGLGFTSALNTGRLFDLDGDPQAQGLPDQPVMDALTGTVVGHFSADYEPAFDGMDGFFLFRGTLTATLLGTPFVVWSRPLPPGIQVMSATVVDGRDVFLADTDGHVYAYDEHSGLPTWTAPGSVVSGGQCGSCPLLGLAVGEHELVVPFGSRLVAYAPAS